MIANDLTLKVRNMKPVKGQNIASWLARFLIATPDQLSSWKGTFTEVTTAKVVEILRRRGCVEEHTMNESRFRSLQNAIYRASVAPPSESEEESFAEEGGKRMRLRGQRRP